MPDYRSEGPRQGSGGVLGGIDGPMCKSMYVCVCVCVCVTAVYGYVRI